MASTLFQLSLRAINHAAVTIYPTARPQNIHLFYDHIYTHKIYPIYMFR